MKADIISLALIFLTSFSLSATPRSTVELGKYFSKKIYSGNAIPTFEESKHLLPKPIFDSKPEYIDFYYRAWQIGFEHFKKPQATSPLVSNFIDEAFNENIFLWDMSFSTMWGNYAHHIFPAIEGLDNFYRMQLPDGEIIREIGEKEGKLGVIGWSEPGTEGNLNHPMLPWAELESYQITGNKQRLAQVYLPLQKYRESFKKIYHEKSGLYLTDKAAMDDSPRNEQMLAGIDVAAEMVIFDRWLAEMASILAKDKDVTFYRKRAIDYAHFINEKLWNDNTGFYYDWGKDNKLMTMRTIAAFWPMLGKIPNEQQLEQLIGHLNDPKSFNTPHRVPTHPKDEVGFNGDYWAGAIWAPTNTMIIQGLEINGKYKLAREIALNHLAKTTQVYLATNTAWENYYPLTAEKGRKAMPDFIGWSGLAPINYLIKHAIGIRVNAGNNEIIWRIHETTRHGIEGLRFNRKGDEMNNISLIAEKRATTQEDIHLTIDCKKPFLLTTIQNNKRQSHEITCAKTTTLLVN